MSSQRNRLLVHDHRQAINAVLAAAQQDAAVQAVCLKGSFGRQEADAHSDIDFYCIVEPAQVDAFLARRVSILEQYRPLIHTSEVNWGNPQLIAVFDNGLYLDFYTATVEILNHADAALVLYDPNGVLAGYQAASLALSDAELIAEFDSFCYTARRIESAYRRGDLPWAIHVTTILTYILAVLYRYTIEPERARIGLKDFSQLLDTDARARFEATLAGINAANLPGKVLAHFEMAQDAVQRLTPETQAALNWRFFEVMRRRIETLAEDEKAGVTV